MTIFIAWIVEKKSLKMRFVITLMFIAEIVTIVAYVSYVVTTMMKMT